MANEPPPYDPESPKKATNLSVNASLLALARARGTNLSRACEEGILRRLAEAEA
jgi:post-segregation antitoxin (ccd killing protein)